MLRYLEEEKDTRGFEKDKGWIHTPAHTADVLKFLARNPRLSPAQQGRLLTAVSGKATAVGHTFTWGEDERLAQVIRSVARRPDLDGAAFAAWLDPFGPAARQLWANGPSIDPDRFSAVQNMKSMLRAAFTALSADTDLPPTAERARVQILKLVSGM